MFNKEERIYNRKSSFSKNDPPSETRGQLYFFFHETFFFFQFLKLWVYVVFGTERSFPPPPNLCRALLVDLGQIFHFFEMSNFFFEKSIFFEKVDFFFFENSDFLKNRSSEGGAPSPGSAVPAHLISLHQGAGAVPAPLHTPSACGACWCTKYPLFGT